jgi:hypothetical protein
LAEKEITKLIQMTRAICGKMGLENIMADKEIRELSQNTSIDSLSQTLEERLPGPRSYGVRFALEFLLDLAAEIGREYGFHFAILSTSLLFNSLASKKLFAARS